MNFLAPLFLAGAVAVGLPVIFHLIRRTTRERKVFGSLMFLKSTPPRLTRRNRLEHIALLLLRSAAICLLALAFARPFIKHILPAIPSSEVPKKIVILVDTSASMRRANLWSQARERVTALVRKASPVDRVALFGFDRQLRPLMTFEEWSSLAAGDRAVRASSRLAETKPGWSATRLDQAILEASEKLSEKEASDSTGLRQIVVVSDFQEGSKLNGLQGQEWPRGVEVIGERITAKTSNAGLQLLGDTTETAMGPGNIRVRVSNSSDSKCEQFDVGWARRDGGFVTNPAAVYVPAGQSRIVTLVPPEKNSSADRIVLRGDEEEFDNTIFNVSPETTSINVIYFGGDSSDDSHGALYFARRALQGMPRQKVEVTAKPATALLAPGEAETANMFIITDSINENLGAALRKQILNGKTTLFAPANASVAATLGNLLGQGVIAVTEGTAGNYAMLGEIDFRHPLFAPFADPRYSDFTKIHFWKYRRFDPSAIPNARAVAKFDNGDAAMIEIPLGKGRVIVLASGWQPVDSQLALSTKFVPLLCSALELSGNVAITSVQAQYHVGDTFMLPAEMTRAGAVVNLPDGSPLKLAAGETNFTQTLMPGVYQVKAGTKEKLFAVNLDASENLTSPLPLDELERLGVPVSAPTPTMAQANRAKTLLQSAELENRQKLWRWFIAATLGMLLMETGLAGWIARKGQSSKAEVPA
jgi:Mg-chelatase subunit ChlD